MAEDKQYESGDVITYKVINEGRGESYPMLCVTEVLQNGVKGIDLRRHKPETFGKEIEITFDSKYSFYCIQKRGIDRDALEKIIEETPERLMAFIST